MDDYKKMLLAFHDGNKDAAIESAKEILKKTGLINSDQLLDVVALLNPSLRIEGAIG